MRQKLMNRDIHSHTTQSNVRPLQSIKNIFVVGSGKGGVGKSTTAVNIAAALKQLGARVGLLDADIYGPNQPIMLGKSEKPATNDDNRLIPLEINGIQSMSIGYLVGKETAMVWRGPMISKALEQLLFDTAWQDLDYLIIDLPPGTGDIPLTLAKKAPLVGAVVVTTPQDVALIDARKALAMFEKLNISVLGIIENMSTHICSQCGHEEAIFGSGGGAAMASTNEITLLGEIPLDIHVRQHADQGEPIADVVDNPVARRYEEIALKLAEIIAQKPKNYALKFPKIVVE